MIFTSDEVMSENYWQIASRVTPNSLFTVTNVLFYFLHAIFVPARTIPLNCFAIVAKDGLFSFSIVTSLQLICDVTRTRVTGIVTSYSSIVLARPNWRKGDLHLRDWSRSGGSYGNNTRVICCPAPRRPESAARGTSPADNKSRGCCCRNSRPTVINPDYNMTEQCCMNRTCIYDKIRPKSPPNRATSPTCLHCDVTHLSLTTGVVALHIPPWRIEVREERRQARKIVWPVNAGRVILSLSK